MTESWLFIERVNLRLRVSKSDGYRRLLFTHATIGPVLCGVPSMTGKVWRVGDWPVFNAEGHW